jgi:hypothetical protein
MPERRYSHEDVQRILASAAEADAVLGPGADDGGLTLADIQRIGAEAGLTAASITAAAAALDRAPRTVGTPRLLWMRTGVSRTVTLPRSLDDTSWRYLAAYVRETFDATGREEERPGQHEWRNGNLRIVLESLDQGALLQMTTHRGNAHALGRVAGWLLVSSAAIETGTAFSAQGIHVAGAAVVLGAGSAAATAIGIFQLRGWTARRTAQFDAVAQYARQLSASSSILQ